MTPKAELIRWARERAGYQHPDELAKKFPKLFSQLSQWEDGTRSPTISQLEQFADKVHVPIGYLFLSSPPDEKLPLADFRTSTSQEISGRPSPDLLDVIYDCQRRQDWYQEFAQSEGYDKLDFVDSMTTEMPPQEAAADIGKHLGFDPAGKKISTSEDACRYLIRCAEEAGILVMVSGIVGSNPRRTLRLEEFRGFALSDPWAPLVFINGRDGPQAQYFTLAHELAHIWLGSSALSNTDPQDRPGRKEEVWCNRVAAKLLVPREELKAKLGADVPRAALSRLAQAFKVSPLVILYRLHDAGRVTDQEVKAIQNELKEKSREEKNLEEKAKLSPSHDKKKGGDFYRTTPKRVSPSFARALITNTLEGQTLYRDACQMLGVKNIATLEKLGRRLGVIKE